MRKDSLAVYTNSHFGTDTSVNISTVKNHFKAVVYELFIHIGCHGVFT